MCGRYAVTSAPEAIRTLFGYAEQPDFPPRYNVAPTQPIAIVRMVDGRRQFALVRWGLLPSWVQDPKNFSLLINARGESVMDKPAFKAAMKYRRCLVPANGFYDWKASATRRQPYYVRANRVSHWPLPGCGRHGPDRTGRSSKRRPSSRRAPIGRLLTFMIGCQ
jgi:putative SOS response-associated peptidase YedK